MFLFYIYMFISTVFILLIFILCSVMISYNVRKAICDFDCDFDFTIFGAVFYTIFLILNTGRLATTDVDFYNFFLHFGEAARYTRTISKSDWILVIFAFTFAQHRPSTSNQRQSGSNWRDWRGAGCGRNPAPARSSCSRRRHHQRRVSFFRTR